MPAPPFVRDRVTVLAYGAIGAYSYYLYALGPVLAFLHRELHLSYTLTGVHSALWAGGTIATGVVFRPLVRRVGRRKVLWGSAIGIVAGALLLIVSHTVGITLIAAAVMGLCGTLVQTATTVILADQHAPRAERALVEGGVIAAGAAVLAPAILGTLSRTPAGWRAGMLIPVVVLALLWAVFRDDRFPAAPPARASAGRDRRGCLRLPRGYWPPAVLVAVVVAMEFSVVFYGAVLLNDDRGLTTAAAATAMTPFFVGILTGRIVGAGFTRRPGRVIALLVAALATTAAGFTVFWLAPAPAFSLVGLFATGLGVANLYPLSLTLAVSRAPGQTDQATGRTQILIGAAVMLAPLTLGAIADKVGVMRAFAVEPALIATAVALLVASSRQPAPLVTAAQQQSHV